MKQQKFSIQKRIKSFSCAFNGFRILLEEEYNARVHIFALAAVPLGGILFKISATE